MEAAELIVTLNAYPMWVEFDDATSNKVFDEIHRLSCLYRCGSLNERRSIAAKLEQAAKFQMFEYSRYKATEATRTPLAINILEGLVPVVMGGGSSRSATAGFLMAILLRSAQLAALDGKRIFADAADLAGTEDQASDFRNFPSMPLEYRSVERFGARERLTSKGVVYDMPGEGPLTWWDRLRGKSAVSKSDLWKTMRDLERG